MAWRRPGDKPLSEPMMVSLPTHIGVTRPQWVKKEQIDLTVIEWHHQQEFGCLTGIPTRARRANDHAVAHLLCQDSSIELEMAQISPAVTSRVTASARISVFDRNSRKEPIGLLPRCCTPTMVNWLHRAWDGMNFLMKRLWRHKDCKKLGHWVSNGNSPNMPKGPMGQLQYHYTSTGQESSIE